jgi:transcriptional regulator with PAS, ATPase and Fis domain
VFRVLGQLLEKTIERIKAGGDAGSIIGVSPAMDRIRQMTVTYALEDEPVLLLGETGVGKSHIAELIHRFSGRIGDFVAAEITSINENLFESTMFGHKKGAFTDARADKKGLVQEAEKGTLFIDEISEIPVSFQAKLLRFIEKKKYRVMGDPKERTADVRIVAASNKNLEKAIADKEFREDLYYRRHVLEIEIPPLRERKEDIRAFIDRNRPYLKDKELGDGFWEAVLDYHWPGNMRELITVLKRAGILLDSPITDDKINNMIYGNRMQKLLSPPAHPSTEPWKQKIVEDLEKGKSFWETVKEPFLERELNREQARAVIAEALEKTGGNYKETLKLLNVDEADYVRFMKFLYRNRLN